ncbi:MAG TPA: pantetheine-phosphate adenylyltransferase [Cyclobacteriaceae bacterium]|nr:pantetheine-phosphate adenylyltransferase [Cyclobacteriaceae bacterium]MCB9238888.1 pantetheine-phosphate adenylyltransferase [Flammeovirgaceae bacterium]MCB0498164.1 pantetheine-phosphate adenylyltransferase [Cyclobacteriaceae bacterium]MCO5270607.1 pantetheine-phosphate adenylyltransferase [Cyclobacteriaceae bacterium]MCW5900952.1 pantetheine-phosphate adenylyltransferase [Cyclobacteriaceae bacterium]
MKRIAIFPGSFDPFTKGHEDIVLRGLKLFDEIIVGIGYNSTKSKRYFEIGLMVKKIEETFAGHPNIKVLTFAELTAAFAKKHHANYLLRGLRNTTDFEYENSISQVNRHLNADLESVFLITTPQFAAISSSIIREVHRYKGDVSAFLPYSL